MLGQKGVTLDEFLLESDSDAKECDEESFELEITAKNWNVS
jgi:hypothetical protein